MVRLSRVDFSLPPKSKAYLPILSKERGMIYMIIKETKRRITQTSYLIEILEEENRQDTAEYNLEVSRLSAFNVVNGYIRSGKWALHQSTSQRVFDALDKGYEAAAEQYNCSVNSVKSSVWNANNAIKQRLGFGVLSAIGAAKSIDDIEAVLRLFEIRSGGVNIKDMFPKEISSEHLPKERDFAISKIDIEDFVYTLKVLTQITTRHLTYMIKTLEPEHINCVFGVLHAKGHKYIEMQGLMYQFLLSELPEYYFREKLSKI